MLNIHGEILRIATQTTKIDYITFKQLKGKKWNAEKVKHKVPFY